MRSRNLGIITVRVVLTAAFCSLPVVSLFIIFSCLELAPDEKDLEEALDLVEGKDCSQAVGILETLITEVRDSQLKSKCLYVLATCYRRLGRWKEAISYYKLVLEENEFLFADLAKLHIATGYRNLYNYGTAIEWYETILRDHSDSFAAVEARYQLGECYSKIEQYEAAIQHYAKFIQDYPEESRVRTVMYKIGCAYQELEEWSEAYIWYQGLLRGNTKDQTARNVLDRLKSLISSHPTTVTMTRDDRMYYGLALYYAGQYKAAREELGKVIGDADNLSAKAAYFVAESYYRERKYSTAIEQYTSVAERYPQSDCAMTSQYQIPLCHWAMGKQEESNALLAEFAAAYPESKLADNAKFQIAENYEKREQYREAIDAYNEVVTKYPASSLADEALWNMGWYYTKLEDNDKSEQTFRRLLNEYPNSRLSGSALFWIGVTREKAGEWQAAVDIYREAAQNRDWYYSDRARRRIRSLVTRGRVSEEMASVHYEKTKSDDSIPAWQNIKDPIPTRAQELLNLRIFDDAIGELLMAVEAAVTLESAYYNLSMCYEKMGDFNKSWVYAWRLSRLPAMRGEDGAMPRQLHRMLYPIAYRDVVFSNSEENKLDPFLVLALMLEESRYDPAAVSPVGAVGLTQIMPPTGRDIAKRLKIQPFQTEMLFQPELNIEMGTWHLGGLVTRFSDLVQKVCADGKTSGSEADHADAVRILAMGAYNGGESRIRRWVERYGIEDIDVFVESIPIYQTKQYIKKVCDSYEMYKSLYMQ